MTPGGWIFLIMFWGMIIALSVFCVLKAMSKPR